MSNENYDQIDGVLDLTDNLTVSVDEYDVVVGVIEGEVPTYSNGDPYRHGIYCRNQDGNTILVTTDMDYQTLVAELDVELKPDTVGMG